MHTSLLANSLTAANLHQQLWNNKSAILDHSSARDIDIIQK